VYGVKALRQRRRASWCAGTILGSLALLLAPTAATAAPPPGDIAAIAVYVETMPTSTGGVVAGKQPAAPVGSEPVELAAPAEAALAEAGEDAAVLKRVATAPELGAPQHVLPVDDKALEPERSVLGPLDISVTDGSSRLPWLVAALAVITGALTAVWGARRGAR
jgi:hypothetical protein